MTCFEVDNITFTMPIQVLNFCVGEGRGNGVAGCRVGKAREGRGQWFEISTSVSFYP